MENYFQPWDIEISIYLQMNSKLRIRIFGIFILALNLLFVSALIYSVICITVLNTNIYVLYIIS